MTATFERTAGTPFEAVRVIAGTADDDELAAILAVTLVEGQVPDAGLPTAKHAEWIRRARMGVLGSRPSWRWASHP